ncbi:uncharacterized protein LOC108227789 [Daucus carota subsp. sativus]|nr:PREDICTED: uncharacterized protein LOC108227789 isoform X1 [Daucus carota subsp. sativus]XP_017258619.1 PREDICTED: uncharacterized protein LOC108227789 isoform X2 [Daucus carota subsp. sativus]
MERFSIREYTCQMRSVDVMKCWPFGPTNIEYVQAFLPAITVKKFKWWTDELENELTEDLTCPVCFVFKALSTQELNGHVSRCIVQLGNTENSRMRAKSRMPKKRSIVELFAVAPQVDKVYEDEDEDGDDLSDQDDHVKLSAMIRTRFNEKRNRKMKSRDLTLVNVSMNSKKRKSGMKKGREADTIDISIDRKDKLLAPKQKRTFNPTENVTASPHILEYAKKLGDAAGKRTKAFGASKLTLGKKKSVFSFHCILKKHSKVVSGKKKSTINTFPDSNEANWCSTNHSNRHVRISGKDDILERRMKSAPHDAVSSETNLLAEERDKFCPLNVDKSKGNSSINREENNEFFSVTEKSTPDTCLCVEKFCFSRPRDSQENLVDRPVASNKFAYYSDHGYEVASPDSSSACPPGSGSMRKMTYKPSITTRGDENLSMSCTSKAKVISHYVDDPRRDGACFKDCVTSFPQASSSSYVSKENWNACGGQISPHSASEKYPGQILRYHPIPHLSPKELMHSLCSPSEMEQRSEVHLGRPRNGDYTGLPLNSHGEYIQLASGKGGFNQTIRPAIFTDSSRTLAFCTEPPSNQDGQLSFINHDERLPSEKLCHVLSSHGQFKEKPNSMESSSLGTTSGTDASLEFRSCDPIYPYKSGINLMSLPSQSNRTDQSQNYSNDRNMYPERHPNLILGNGTQPTMRLMGQEFSIGKNYRNSHEGQKVWMDNQIMVHHDGNAISYESSRHFQQDLMMQRGIEKNKRIASSSEIQIDMLSQSVFQIIPPDSRFSSPSIGCQTNAVYENACRAFGGVPVPQTYPYLPPDYSPAIFNKGSSSQETFVCEHESLPLNHQPVRASSSYNAYQSLSSNYAENSRMLPQPHSTSSAFKFPFLYTDLGEHAQPYNCQSSSKSITSSLLNAAQANESTIGSFQFYSNATDSHHHHCISSNNFQKSQFVRCTTDVPYIHNPLTIQSPLQNGPNLASIARPPIRPRFLPTSTMNEKREYRLKFKERIKARLCVKDPQSKRTKKKPGSKPVKLTTPGDMSSGVTVSKLVGDAEIGALERKETTVLDRSGDVAKTIISASKPGNPLEGPLKLTAGAKHIFNPSGECMYSSDSKLTHSKVPFTTQSDSAIPLESHPSKIYRF